MAVIYAVEGSPVNQQRALTHLAALEQAGHGFAISHLTWTECLVPLWIPSNAQRLSDFFRFFHGANLRTVGLTAAICSRAAAIRGSHTYPADPAKPVLQPRKYGLADSIHLAGAIESGWDVLLTNDDQLSNFPDIIVEKLP